MNKAYQKLNPKQQRFCDEYLIDRNATRAYRVAYNAKDTVAGANGARLLNNAKIRAVLDAAIQAQQERTEITADKTLRETAALAFSDIRKLFEEDGKFKDLQDLDDDTAAALASVDVVTMRDGPEVMYVKKIKFWDKNAALEKLGKHLKLFVERKEVTGEDGGPIVLEERMNQALEQKAKILKGATDGE